MKSLTHMRAALAPLHIAKSFATSPNAHSNAMKAAISQRRKDMVAKPKVLTNNPNRIIAKPFTDDATLKDTGEFDFNE